MPPLAVADPGEAPPPLFLDQTEAQRAGKIRPGPAYLRVWMTGPLPLSKGLV